MFQYCLTPLAPPPPQTDQQTGAEVTFRIDLLDSNDEVPIFYGIDPVTVPENSEPGTHVAVATAIDKDGTPPNNQVRERSGWKQKGCGFESDL